MGSADTSVIIQGHLYRHGDPVICKIKGILIKDAKIHIQDDATLHICQNVFDGHWCNGKFGYKYSWAFNERNGELTQNVSELSGSKCKFCGGVLNSGEILCDYCGLVS